MVKFSKLTKFDATKKEIIPPKVKKALRKFAVISRSFFRKMKPLHYVALVLILALGIFNGATSIYPLVKQQKREQNIVKTFNNWWLNAGAQEFRMAGLEPTKELKAEEFERYREKYLAQNASFIIEEKVAYMKKGYREWWENQGGREDFINKTGRYPNDTDYQNSLQSWIYETTDKHLRYNLAFVPKRENYEKIFTSWILIPSICSFLTFAGLFFFALWHLVRRWDSWVIIGFSLLVIAIGPILVSLLTSTSFFDHYSGERYMGMSLTVAFLLGAASFETRRIQVTKMTTNICVAGLILDMVVNWCANPGIFGAVSVLSPAFFGLGALAGIKLEPRRKSRDEINAELLAQRLLENASRNPMAERKAKTRALIEEGFTSAKNCRPDQAHQQLSMALNQLLQEHPIDATLVKNTVERMTAPDQYLSFSSNQWMEWGEIAKTKNAPDAAMLLLTRSLSLEKDPNFARRILFVLGEISINNKIEIQEGISRLKKVIEMNENDMLAKQAKKMLESQTFC